MSKKEKVGLYFGSFNPIHLGHIHLAEFILNNSDLDKVCFVLSPQNPFKSEQNLLKDNLRLEMIKLAIGEREDILVSDIELSLPKPSYTINTLKELGSLYPNILFSIIMGEDNLVHLDKWKDYKTILDRYQIYVYPRQESSNKQRLTHENIRFIEAPLLDISSTKIRNLLLEGHSIEPYVPKKVEQFIIKNKLYR